MACLSDDNCESCTAIGTCSKCIAGHKFVNNRCVCESISECLYCPSKDVCNSCDKNKIINPITKPYKCVTACPENTREIGNKCYKNLEFVEIIGAN